MKKYIYRATFLIVLFCVVVLGVFWLYNREEEYPEFTTMQEAELPIVSLKLGENTINELHGYTCEPDVLTIRDCITPLVGTRKLPVTIDTYSGTVTSLSYEVRSLNMDRLLEDTEVTDYQTGEGVVNATFNIKNLLDEGQEYLLIINVGISGRSEKAAYYTRIIFYEESDAETYLNFAKDFSDKTFNSETIEEVIPYLETSSQGDNTNIGKVNIYCKMSQIGFADLTPVKTSETSVRFMEVSRSLTTVQLDYIMSTTDDTKTSYYDVKEVYKLKYVGDVMYVLAYDREVTERFTGINALTSNARINLGISPDYEYDIMADTKGTYTAFVANKELWCYNSDSNAYAEVFSFRNNDSDGVRENYRNHDIKILSVSNDGVIRFMVYGYMNRGVHEGQLGVSVFEFSYETNLVNEILFMPATTGFEVLKSGIDELAYLSENDILYIMFEGSIYSIDLVGRESMVIVKNAEIGTFVVSSDSTVIAWLEEGLEYDSGTVNVLYLATGEKNIVSVEETMRIKPLGFIGHDFIYGQANAQDIINEATGETLFPMWGITIIDSNSEVVKEYQTAGVYVTKAVVDGNRITFERVSRDEAGDFVPASSDQIISKELEEDEGVSLLVVATEVRQKETYLVLDTTVSDISRATTHLSKEVVFSDEVQLNLKKSESTSELFYAYGNGELLLRTNSMADAIIAADARKGVVVEAATGIILWANGQRDSYGTSDIPELIAAEGNGMTECITIMNQVIYGSSTSEINENFAGLTGCTCDMMLYYVSKGWPVMVKCSDSSYGVIYEYDQFNITFYNPVTGKSTKVARDDTADYFAEFGNVFVTAVR